MNKLLIRFLEKLLSNKRKKFINKLNTKYYSDINISAEDIRIASNTAISGLRDVFMNNYYKAPTRKQYDEILKSMDTPKRLFTPDSAAFLFKHYMELIGFSACAVALDKTNNEYYNVIAIRPEYADTLLYVTVFFPSTGENVMQQNEQPLNGYILW